MQMKAVAVVVLVALAAVSVQALTQENYQFLFTKYVAQYNKAYESDSFLFRYEIFRNNLDLVLAHNAKNLSWTMAINEFSDLTSEEFKAMKTGLRGKIPSLSDIAHPYKPARPTVAALDW